MTNSTGIISSGTQSRQNKADENKADEMAWGAGVPESWEADAEKEVAEKKVAEKKVASKKKGKSPKKKKSKVVFNLTGGGTGNAQEIDALSAAIKASAERKAEKAQSEKVAEVGEDFDADYARAVTGKDGGLPMRGGASVSTHKATKSPVVGEMISEDVSEDVQTEGDDTWITPRSQREKGNSRSDGFNYIQNPDKGRHLKTVMCTGGSNGGVCDRDPKHCNFAHSDVDLNFSDCGFGSSCRFQPENNQKKTCWRFKHPGQSDADMLELYHQHGPSPSPQKMVRAIPAPTPTKLVVPPKPKVKVVNPRVSHAEVVKGPVFGAEIMKSEVKPLPQPSMVSDDRAIVRCPADKLFETMKMATDKGILQQIRFEII